MSALQMKYFVLKPGGDSAYAKASRQAMRAFALSIHPVNRELAAELCQWADRESLQANALEDDRGLPR